MNTSKKIRKLEFHGRETYAVYYGDKYVMKRPLPSFGPDAQLNWLIKQHRTQDVLNEIRSKKNPAYNVPEMIYINDDEVQLLEERAPGQPLTKELYRSLPGRQKYEIRHGIASFLTDMNELKDPAPVENYKIASELKMIKLENFVENKMSNWFNNSDIKYMVRLKNNVKSFEYETRKVWSHADLNSENVYYDYKTNVLSFIDFAEANYQFVYRDIFAPLQIALSICKNVYEIYYKLHNKKLFLMPGVRNPKLEEIMKYRFLVVYMRRFIKAADDLRLNPANEKSVKNNIAKVHFIKEQIKAFQDVERMFAR